MPEAAVDEHGDLAAGERDVRADTARRQVEPEVLAIAVTHGVQRGPQRQLGLGVGAAVAPHVRRPARIGGERVRLTLGGRLRRGPARRRVLGLAGGRPRLPWPCSGGTGTVLRYVRHAQSLTTAAAAGWRM